MSRSAIRTMRLNRVRLANAAKAFTLVELLVVIGIIALLVSILLPALNSARRQANTIKCAAALREIGKAYMMYANDNKGWWPPAKLIPDPLVSGLKYSLYNTNYGTGVDPDSKTTPPAQMQPACYWWDFVGKYISSYQPNTSNNTANATLARSTVIWGCTEWQGYGVGFGGSSSSSDLIAPLQPGYGVNFQPLKTPAKDDLTSTIINPWRSGATGFDGTKPNINNGTFLRLVQYKNSAQRGLVADASFWIWQSVAPTYLSPLNKTDQTLFQVFIDNTTTINTNSWADWYRHGKNPGTTFSSAGTIYDPTKGKVAYNILYCDGHVATSSSKRDVFSSIRMRYPG